MKSFPQDIYTEPSDIDVDTLRNLGPLAPMAGIWEGTRGLDVHPKAEGPKKQAYVERYELQPIDPQANGPQLFYGLRYHTHIVKPGEVETFHDQVGYWLWEPADGTLVLTLSIPRAQCAMAFGKAERNARTSVTINDDGTWSYDQDTVLILPGQAEPFHHTDRATLRKIGEPTPNPLARS